MPNDVKETIEVWREEDSKIRDETIDQIDPNYFATLWNKNPYGEIKVGLGRMLQIINILKKSNGNFIWNTIPKEIWKIAEREAILLRLE